jgi:hypothetical protein
MSGAYTSTQPRKCRLSETFQLTKILVARSAEWHRGPATFHYLGDRLRGASSALSLFALSSTSPFPALYLVRADGSGAVGGREEGGEGRKRRYRASTLRPRQRPSSLDRLAATFSLPATIFAGSRARSFPKTSSSTSSTSRRPRQPRRHRHHRQPRQSRPPTDARRPPSPVLLEIKEFPIDPLNSGRSPPSRSLPPALPTLPSSKLHAAAAAAAAAFLGKRGRETSSYGIRNQD